MENKTDKFFYYRMFIFSLVAGILIHLASFSEKVMMADGVLNEVWRKSNNWEITQGRWMLVVLDKINHHIVLSYVTTTISLIIMALVSVMLLKMWELRSVVIAVVVVLLWMVNPQFAQLLSDPFVSAHYSLAMLFSVGAIYLVSRQRENCNWLVMLSGCLMIAISLGIYQAYYAVSAFLSVAFIIWLLLKECNVRECVKVSIRLLFCLIGGGIFYIIITQVLFFILDLNWAQYRDMGSIGHIKIEQWIQRIVNAFSFGGQCYFSDDLLNVSWWKWKPLFLCDFSIVGIVITLKIVKNISNKRTLEALFMLVCMILLIPIFGIVDIMTETGVGILLTPQIMLPFIFSLIVVSDFMEDKGKLKNTIKHFFRFFGIGLSVIIFYQMVIYCGTYYKLIKLTYDKTLAMGTKISYELTKIDEYIPGETPVAILGNAVTVESLLPSEKEVWDAMKGSHAQYTLIHYVNSIGGQACWQFLLSYHLGMKIETLSSEDIMKICKSDEFEAMNSSQTGDYIKLWQSGIAGIDRQAVVVKLSSDDILE